MQKSLWIAALASTVCSLYAGRLKAQDRPFNADGRVVIGAERLTGVFIEKLNVVATTTDTSGATPEVTIDETDLDTTSFALLGQGSGLGFTGDTTSAGGPSATPRFGVDVFVTSGFSVGGSIMYTNSSGTSESTETVGGVVDAEPEEDQPTVDLLILNPRVGYGYAVSPAFAIWPRLGFTYARYSSHEEDETGGPMPTVEETDVTLTMTDINLEFMMAVTPVPNVAILFGPFVDIGLGGGVDVEVTPPGPDDPTTTEIDVTYTSFGFSAGIGIVF